jgi:hypothetical protein
MPSMLREHDFFFSRISQRMKVSRRKVPPMIRRPTIFRTFSNPLSGKSQRMRDSRSIEHDIQRLVEVAFPPESNSSWINKMGGVHVCPQKKRVSKSVQDGRLGLRQMPLSSLPQKSKHYAVLPSLVLVAVELAVVRFQFQYC